MRKSLEHFRAERWLYIFIAVHLIGWTFVPALIRYNLPLDAIEGTIWGHQLEWGYDKNPFLNGWLTALAIYLGGQSGWMVYLFSQISVVICFWAVWQLAHTIFAGSASNAASLPHTQKTIYALISVLILEGIQYYNFHAIDFNDNTLELGLWGLSIYFFYRALRARPLSSTHYLAWIATGLFAGLGMMAKYYTAALLAAMALFLIINTDNRKQLKSPPPYAGLFIFSLIILPHIIWLFFHDFITVTYVLRRTSSPPSWTNHFFFPAQFAWQQAQAFLPAAALLIFLLIGKKPCFTSERIKLNPADKVFLFSIGVGPFLLTILLSLLLGIKLRAGWGMPLLSLWGIMLVASVQPAITKEKLSRFLTLIFIVIGTLLSGYTISLIHSSDPSSANFPGYQVAQTITQEWRQQYNTQLEYISGSRWIGGNIGFYSNDHPAVFIEWKKQYAPWINMEDMRKKGAVFVWDITAGETLPLNIRKQFPALSPSRELTFSWLRNTHKLSPIKIGIAYLAPAQKSQLDKRPNTLNH